MPDYRPGDTIDHDHGQPQLSAQFEAWWSKGEHVAFELALPLILMNVSQTAHDHEAFVLAYNRCQQVTPDGDALVGLRLLSTSAENTGNIVDLILEVDRYASGKEE